MRSKDAYFLYIKRAEVNGIELILDTLSSSSKLGVEIQSLSNRRNIAEENGVPSKKSTEDWNQS